MRLRLIYAHQHALPGERPEELQLLQTADALAELGHEVMLISPASHARQPSVQALLGRAASPNLLLSPLAHAGRWFRSKRPFHWALARQIARLRPDAVYVRNYRLAAWLASRRLGLPIFFEVHELRAQAFREEQARMTWRARRKLARVVELERSVFNQSDGLICITHCLMDDVRAAYGAQLSAVVAPDGVDLALAERAREHGRVAAAGRLLYLGSLHTWKGVELLLEAIAQVPQANLDIAGGPLERVAQLQALAARLAVSDRVRFLGFVAPAHRFELIAQSDVCLLPSTPTSIGSRYTSPLKLFEYMSMGKAIVAGDYPAIREVLRDNETALLVQGAHAAGFAHAIARLLGDAALRQRLGDRAREHARRYTWQARAATIAAFIRSTVVQEHS